MSEDDQRRFEETTNYRAPENLINILTPDGRLKSSFKDDIDTTKRAPWPIPEHILRRTEDDDRDYSTDFGFSDSELIPAELRGLDRFEARKRIVELLQERGYLEKIEPHIHFVPHGDRSGVVIEPFLTDQWYVEAIKLALPAIDAVREGKTKFIPNNWEKTFFDLGVSQDRFGGGIKYRLGMAPMAKSSLNYLRQKPLRQQLGITRAKGRILKQTLCPLTALNMRRACELDGSSYSATRTCSTLGSRRRCGLSRRSAGPTKRRS
jgi:hypothetical protein